MKIENTRVFGMESAMHGMRNPMNSWCKGDSRWEGSAEELKAGGGCFFVGEEDNRLAKKLIKAGSEHRKFLRQIHISCFITLPRYIWQEMDTYKVATVRNSCSTMHKLGFTDLTVDDFQDGVVLDQTLFQLNLWGKTYRETKDVQMLRAMKQILPEGFLQSADFDMNYETAMNMYAQRKDHRMSEWSGKGGICEWILSLPMMREWINCKFL